MIRLSGQAIVFTIRKQPAWKVTGALTQVFERDNRPAAQKFSKRQRPEQNQEQQGQLAGVIVVERFLKGRHRLLQDQFPFGQIADIGFRDIERFLPAFRVRGIGRYNRHPLTDPSIKTIERSLAAHKGCHHRLIGAVGHNDVAVFIKQCVERGIFMMTVVEVLPYLLQVKDSAEIAAVFSTNDHRRKHCNHWLGSADPGP